MAKTQAQMIELIRDCYSRESSADPDNWSPENSALGQCEVASFVAWEHLGGELVLGRVMLNGVQTEHHYWNRIDGNDVDLSRDQFRGAEVIEELSAMPSEAVAENRESINQGIADRILILSAAVRDRLDGPDSSGR